MGEAFTESIEHTLCDSATRQQLLEGYNLHNAHADSMNDTADKVLHFANDIGFYAPLISIASGWLKKHTSFILTSQIPGPDDSRELQLIYLMPHFCSRITMNFSAMLSKNLLEPLVKIS
jgi:hypothetical protein